MSSQVDQQTIWTPPVIATIVYRVVMIFVSIAFLWKKYRRPTRHLDEEQLVGVLLPHSNIRARRATPTLREVILAHIEDMVQSAIGLDKGDDSSINGLPDLSINEPSLDANIGLDIELGDIVLPHRSADHLQPTKYNENKEDL